MKNFKQNKRQFIMALVVNVLVLSASVSAWAQASKEYTTAEAAQLKIDIEAKAYDVYILSTSGGVYDFNSNIIKKTTTIKAKSGLSEKPIIKSISSSQSQLIRVDNSPVRDTITFEGLEFDGAGFDGSTPLIVRSMDNTHLVFNDCYIHDAYNTNGAIRSDKANSSVDINNTLFANCKQRLVLFYDNFAYGDVNISNCTFTGVPSGDIVYFRVATSSGSKVNIDHCTFYDITGNITRLDLDNILGDVKVTNSIFVDVTGNLNADIIDYCYVDGLGTVPTATNSITTAPIFMDAANMDLALDNKLDMVGSDLLTLGDLSWYADDVVTGVDDAMSQKSFNMLCSSNALSIDPQDASVEYAVEVYDLSSGQLMYHKEYINGCCQLPLVAQFKPIVIRVTTSSNTVECFKAIY